MTWEEIKAWRKAQRAAARRDDARRSAETERKRMERAHHAHLLDGFEMPRDAVVGFCWPYQRGVRCPLRGAALARCGRDRSLAGSGGRRAPLQFRKWWPGAPMRPGVYDIPLPDGTEIVVPDIALVPMNGFDATRLSAGLWRRLLRSHARAMRPAADRGRRELRGAAPGHDLSAAARHADGFRGDRGGRVCGRRGRSSCSRRREPRSRLAQLDAARVCLARPTGRADTARLRATQRNSRNTSGKTSADGKHVEHDGRTPDRLISRCDALRPSDRRGFAKDASAPPSSRGAPA